MKLAVDSCSIFSVENGFSVSKTINFIPDEKMGREKAVFNFVETVRGKAKPVSNPKQAIILMKIIDAIYKSASENEPVRIQ